jgi:hypothetical protein
MIGLLKIHQVPGSLCPGPAVEQGPQIPREKERVTRRGRRQEAGVSEENDREASLEARRQPR